ncbi:sec-independent translocase [Nocardioides caldifontis]|uniref:sec-independent translocase n=1 Tax=Nocardioides caldifontis TaxID=2588938 RepID=UPI0011E05665|nr:sec-independent translocase [Nocardioides caldifontis]
MMGIGLAEFLVIGVVALLVFGPDRLPDFARQAGRMVRQVRTLTRQTRDDIRNELGPEYADFELTDLDPRKALRKHIMEAWEDEDDEPAPRRKERPLRAGETPPYDVEAT